MAEPIVKWLGGKRQLLPQIRQLMPKNFKSYYEPFLGGGAVFFELIDPKKHGCYLNDINYELMLTYEAVQHNPKELMKEIDKLEQKYNNAYKTSGQRKADKVYYDCRKKYNSFLIRPAVNQHKLSCVIPALFIFLNKTSFNGVYRVNKKGLYNVPTGHKKHVSCYDKNNITAASAKLKSAHLSVESFKKALRTAQSSDFVFLDPPYYGGKTFTSYQTQAFGQKQQEKVFRVYQDLTRRGIFCMLTNSCDPFIINMYRGSGRIHTVCAKRYVNRNARGRHGKEIIVTNY